MSRTPIVLVTSDVRTPKGNKPGPRVRPKRPEVFVGQAYLRAVETAGGLPVVLPPGPIEPLAQLLATADAVVLTGGNVDVHPSLYGELPKGRLDRIEPSRTARELALAEHCLHEGIPVLGICGGMQVMAVGAGGRLIQDIQTENPNALQHEQPTDPATPWHEVHLQDPASRWLGTCLQVNSTHHQAVRDPGSMVACGWSSDGIVEAIADPSHPFALGLQWHPELLEQYDAYRALVEAARKN